VNILSISDKIVSFIYSRKVKTCFENVDFVIACGDLPYFYQEFIISSLDVPLYFVRGNHDKVLEQGPGGPRKHPLGAVDLHKRNYRENGILFAGVEGSIRYKAEGKFQYSQLEMWWNVLSLVPGFILNRILYGRYLDIFITHASPWGIHDKEDYPHQGIKAFTWLIKTFQPQFHFHGHIHVYRPDEVTQTQVGKTIVINTFGYKETKFVPEGKSVLGGNFIKDVQTIR
jgi:Icc-related predicted phosphoesterase